MAPAKAEGRERGAVEVEVTWVAVVAEAMALGTREAVVVAVQEASAAVVVRVVADRVGAWERAVATEAEAAFAGCPPGHWVGSVVVARRAVEEEGVAVVRAGVAPVTAAVATAAVARVVVGEGAMVAAVAEAKGLAALAKVEVARARVAAAARVRARGEAAAA